MAVDLSGVANGSWCNVGGGAMFGCSMLPTGNLTVNGENFTIANGSNGNAWFSSVAANNGAGTVTLNLQNLNVSGATAIHTLINTFWGQSSASYDSVTVTGSLGTFTTALTGNNQLRDYNNYIWTNTILSPSTQAVSSDWGAQRLDEQTILLPTQYVGETITGISLTDSGNELSSRAFLAALTIDDSSSLVTAAAAVPEPSYAAVVGLALLGAGVFFRRRLA